MKDLSLSLGSLKARAIGEMDESGVKQDVILFYAFWCSKTKKLAAFKSRQKTVSQCSGNDLFHYFSGR